MFLLSQKRGFDVFAFSERELSRPFVKHIRLSGVSLAFDDKKNVKIIQSTNSSIPFPESLEALWQREIRPTINTKDEYWSRELTIKL